VDFAIVLINVVISTFMPASNRITLRARVLMIGEIERNRSLSKYPSTGPRSIPNPSTQIMSGTFVFW
jgi:hypothetical protein